jgi:hypothetical protein
MADEKRGRPTKFNEAIREKILELAKSGKTNSQIADIVGVHVRTLENWQGKHKDFLWAFRESKSVADDLVEAAFFQRAVGYTHDSEKIFCTKDGKVRRVKTKEHYPPDVSAGQFWLTNRQPGRWKNKQKGEDDHTVEHKHKFETLSDAELDEEIKKRTGSK